MPSNERKILKTAANLSRNGHYSNFTLASDCVILREMPKKKKKQELHLALFMPHVAGWRLRLIKIPLLGRFPLGSFFSIKSSDRLFEAEDLVYVSLKKRKKKNTVLEVVCLSLMCLAKVTSSIQSKASVVLMLHPKKDKKQKEKKEKHCMYSKALVLQVICSYL